jgi:hypothetical protein
VSAFLCRLATDLCRGAIRSSGGARFCCKPSRECSIKYHKSSKVNVQSNRLYIQAPRLGQARLEPCLDAACLPSDVRIEDLLEMQRHPDVMVTYFESLLAQGLKGPSRGLGLDAEADDDLMSDSSWIPVVASPNVRDIDEARRTLQSPQKLKIGVLLSEMAETAPTGVPQLAPMSVITPEEIENMTGDPAAIGTVIQEWNQMVSNVESVAVTVNSQSASDLKFRQVLAKTVQDLQGTINGAQIKIQLVLSRLGSDKSSADGGSDSLWDAIRALRVTTADMRTDLTSALEEARLASSTASVLDINVSNLSTSFENLADSYSANFKKLNGLVSQLLSNTGQMPTYVGPSVSRAVPSATPMSPEIRVSLDDLGRRIDAVGSQPMNSAKFDDLVDEVQLLNARVSSGSGSGTSTAQAQIDALVAKILDMESRVMDESVVVGDYSFGSFADLKKWVEVNQVPSCGVFWDLLSVLISMGPKEQSGKDRAEEEYAATRIKSTISENDLAASMSHVKPKLLYGRVTREQGFGCAIPSRDAWVGKGVTSIKKTLSTYLDDYVSGINGHVTGTSNGGDGLARALLSQVSAHWLSLTEHFGKFYDDLVDISNFSKPTAHLLVGRSSHAIWDDMRRYRSRIALLTNMNRLDTKASYIWGVLQCHRVMQEYVKASYQSHPSFVKELSLFMLTERVDPSQLDTLSTKMSEMTALFEKMKREHKALDEKYSILKRSHDAALVDIKNLKAAKKGKQQADTP